MKLSRRQFAYVVGAAPAVWAASGGDRLLERRVYDRAGVVPPHSAMRRCGIERFERHEDDRHVEFRISFRSLAERTRAWDRFNSDPEWCALRSGGDVRLREISFGEGA